MNPGKILVIRLSAMGDVVLTTPALRSLRRRFPDARIDFLVKAAYAQVLQHNPSVDRVIPFEGEMRAAVEALRKENYDLVVDLHNNLRSKYLRRALAPRRVVLDKERWRTNLYIRLGIGSLPTTHVVERYQRAIAPLGCTPDDAGLDFFLMEEERERARLRLQSFSTVAPVAVVLGATKATKRWPTAYFAELLNALQLPVVLLGGPAEREEAHALLQQLQVPAFDAVGTYTIAQAAAFMRECRWVITHDTGMMHIAAAMNMKIFSIWGQTVPALGFSPYKADWVAIENKGLNCRPCSKIGYDSCPKKHFKCMLELSPARVLEQIRAELRSS